MVRTCVIAPINVCRRFSREIKCVFFRVCRIVMCMWVSSNKPNPDSNKIVPRDRKKRENQSSSTSARLYLNNAHERKIIIRIKSKVFFQCFFFSFARVCNYFTFFISSQRARARYIFLFCLLSIFFFFSFPLPTCFRDFFLFL